MIALTNDQTESVRRPLDIWVDECLASPNIRVSGSFQVQIYTLLANIQKVVPSAEPFTYDIDADPIAKANEYDNLWYALAYYLKKYNGESDRSAYKFAESQWKSLRSGTYSLQTIAMAAERSCFVTAQNVDGRDSRIITMNGNYETASGETVAQIAGGRDYKRWEEQTKAMFVRSGIDESKASMLTKEIKIGAIGAIDASKYSAIENQTQ